MTPFHRRRWTGYLFLAPFAAAFTLFVLVPFVCALGLAFCQYDLTTQRPMRWIGLRNFYEAVHDRFFWKALGVTFTYAAWVVPTQLLLSLLLAMGMNAMSRGDRGDCGQRIVRAMLFLPGIFSIAVAGILWQWFYNREFGLFNYLLRTIGIDGVPWLSDVRWAMPSIVLMTLWWTIGGSAAVVLNGLQQIPRPILEAAEIDGASPAQRFWFITLPMLQPVLLFMVLMNTIGAFQMFGQAVLLTGGGPEMSTRGVVSLIYDTAFGDFRLGYAAAISWILFLIIIGFSVIQFRILRRFAR